MIEVSGNPGELPREAASGLSDRLGRDRDKKIMLFALKEALKEVVAAVVECEEARDTAERRMNRLKEQEVSLRGLIRERWSMSWNQQKCLDLGFKYWRTPDAHGVTCTKEQAVMFMQEMLGVEVEIKSA